MDNTRWRLLTAGETLQLGDESKYPWETDDWWMPVVVDIGVALTDRDVQIGQYRRRRPEGR